MSSSPSSRLALVLIVALICSAGIAAGVTVSDERTPEGVEVGATVEASYTLTELYQNPTAEEWTLRTETELRNVTWTFQLVDQAGNVVETNGVDGQNASQPLAIDEGVSEVRVSVVGQAPAVENYTYEPAPTFLVAELRHAREGGTSSTIATYEARHYTQESQEAREAIEAAEAAIESGGGSTAAEESLQSAIDAYEGENFDNAVNSAQRAEREANQAAQTQQRNRYILYGAIALVVLAVIAGVVYWFLNRDTGSRL